MGTKTIYSPLTDPDYQDSYIDVEEDRARTLSDGTEIPFHYVHGGFAAQSVKFILCMPLKDQFKGRFFQYLSPFPGPDEEMASIDMTGEDDKISFALINGAISVESNMGSSSQFGGYPDATKNWKASAAVAEFCRKKAMEYYGCERPVGVVYGGSGGGYKTMACIENTDSWEGAVPYVIGSPVSLPNTITMRVQGQRVLRNAFGKIIDAIDEGGSGDMYAGLDEQEAAMLKELTLMGIPPLSWFLEAAGRIEPGALPVLTPGVKASDPSYFTDFWEKEGYEGSDPASGAVRDRLVFRTRVKEVHLSTDAAQTDALYEGTNGVDTAWRKSLAVGNGAYIVTESIPEGENLYLQGVNIIPQEGEAKGLAMLLDKMIPVGEGAVLTIGMCFGMASADEALGRIKPGDELLLDNSDYIAIQSYYRHQTPDDLAFHAWDQFRDENGKPKIPRREKVMGYGFTGTGTVQDGQIQGKVINVQALMDESTCPWCADWYRKTTEKAGNGKNHRVYFMERCLHGDVALLASTMVVNYLGALRQAILDVAEWVQTGKEPLPSTVYENRDNQIFPEEDIAGRFGLQPKVTLTAGGLKCLKVKPGEEFTLRVEAFVPQGAGEITSVAYDLKDYRLFDGSGLFPIRGEFERIVRNGVHGAVSELTVSLDEPGTHFLTARVGAQRNGDAKDLFTQVMNLDRVRVIVE